MMSQLFYNVPSFPDRTVVDSQVRSLGSSDYVTLGSGNNYPTYLNNLYKNVPVLRSLIEGSSLLSGKAFSSEVMPALSVYNMFQYLFIHGWCPLLVRQSFDKKSFFLTPLNPMYVRTNMNRSIFCYSESPGFKKKVEYPAYAPSVDGSSILYISINDLEYPYALPIWSSALKSVDILSKVAEYHDNALYNQFSASALINFNNGIPSSEDKDNIERMVKEKFAGSQNAQKIMVAFNDDKEHQADIQTFSTEDTSNRYHDLVDSCRQDLFTAFRATPSLFGMPDGAANALAAVEYKNQFTLFKAFTLSPICDMVYEQLKQFGTVYDANLLTPILSE